MKLTLYTETFIDSAHQLRGYNGPCCNIHGHIWKLGIWIKGTEDQLDRVGILYDFTRIKEIHNLLDHKFINDIPPFNKVNPTAENLVMFIYNTLKNKSPELLFKVRVYETPVGKETYCEGGDFE